MARAANKFRPEVSDGARVGTNGSKRSAAGLSRGGRLSDTRTIIHLPSFPVLTSNTPTGARKCVLGINHQVQNGLLQLRPIAMHRTCSAIARKLNSEARPRDGKFPHVHRNAGELTEIDVDALPDRRLRKRGNLRDRRRHAVALRTQALQRPARGLG
jgi:hypothetical protein